jgi:transcriptional regulator with XRE-family HTH domain
MTPPLGLPTGTDTNPHSLGSTPSTTITLRSTAMKPTAESRTVNAHADLAARLKAARDYLGLSQEAVALHLKISRPAVSALERGQRKVSSVELQQLARLYGKPVSYFLDEQEEPVLEADETSSALFRAARQLSEVDRQQVLQFAEFLRNSPAAKRA